MRFGHLLFRAWVAQVPSEEVHGAPTVGDVKAVVSGSDQAVAFSDGASAGAALVTPPALKPLPVILPSPPVPPPPANIQPLLPQQRQPLALQSAPLD